MPDSTGLLSKKVSKQLSVNPFSYETAPYHIIFFRILRNEYPAAIHAFCTPFLSGMAVGNG
jgi:hypothetical protein